MNNFVIETWKQKFYYRKYFCLATAKVGVQSVSEIQRLLIFKQPKF